MNLEFANNIGERREDFIIDENAHRVIIRPSFPCTNFLFGNQIYVGADIKIFQRRELTIFKPTYSIQPTVRLPSNQVEMYMEEIIDNIKLLKLKRLKQ